MPKSMIVTFHSPLHPGLSLPLLLSIFPFMISHLCQLLPPACPSLPPQHYCSLVFVSSVVLKLLLSKDLLLISTPDRHISFLLLFQLPGTFGMIFSLFDEEASTAGCLPASSSLSLRHLCQLHFFLLLKIHCSIAITSCRLYSFCISFFQPGWELLRF